MTKKALGRGLDALISGGVVRSVAAEPPHVEVATAPPATDVVQPLGSRLVSTNGDDRNAVRYLGIDTIERSRFQPRTEFDPEQLRELADSVKQRGVIQPLLVRPLGATAGANRYELIAGERRWRAAREAGL